MRPATPKPPDPNSRHRPAQAAPARRTGPWKIVALLTVAIVAGTWTARLTRGPTTANSTATPSSPNPSAAAPASHPPPGPVTYHRDVAPILTAHCAPCHHPGEAAPFELLTYADARKRARQIADMTRRRLMPPWLPAPGPFALEGDRSLSEDQIGTLQRWADQGAPEGTASESTPKHRWNDGWQLGKPDLVVTMPEPFAVPAEGEDVYRNFVLPVSNATRRFVRAIEFNPGNRRVVHHAFLLLDPTRESRRSDAREAGPGFDGLHTPRTAQPPEGHFLSWQPGKVTRAEPPGLAWPLEPGTDLVIQMHLRPSGRPEPLQASVGLYFTDTPPTRTPFKLGLRSFTIDIPPGIESHWIREELTLPVDVDVLRILPHVHYLGRELYAVARLPDGRELPLLSIPRWDFNWQGDYTYRQPVFLPGGTTVAFRYRFDNSTNNPVNPFHPPQRVRYGLRSVDEMAELWLLVQPRNPADRATLADAYRPRLLAEALLYNQYLLDRDPNDARALTEIAKVRLAENRPADALPLLNRAAASAPEADEPHYFLGLALRMTGDPGNARAAFRRAVAINPDNGKAHGNLGLVAMELGAREEAAAAFRAALRLNPDDQIARRNLEAIAPPTALPKNPGNDP